jgi:hypothetical protein
MDSLFIFKSSRKNFRETWFYGSEDLPPNTITAISPNGGVFEAAWAGSLHEAICNLV